MTALAPVVRNRQEGKPIVCRRCGKTIGMWNDGWITIDRPADGVYFKARTDAAIIQCHRDISKNGKHSPCGTINDISVETALA